MDVIQGDWLLDIGTGPAIYNALFESRKFKNIVLSDYVSSNREDLIKWVNDDSDAYDWTKTAEYVAKLENSDKQLIIERTRKAVKAVIPVDANKPKLIPPVWFQKFDCVASSICLEVVALNPESLKNVTIKSIKEILKPKGFLVIQGGLNETFFAVGGKRYSEYGFKIEDIVHALKENNFEILCLRTIDMKEAPQILADGDALYFIVAQSI
jgi:SAM-dependent methyltransferase